MSIEAEKQEPVGQLQEVAFGRGQVMWFKKPEDETMLYTHPPKREWVGLTDFEKLHLKTNYSRLTPIYHDKAKDTDVVADIVDKDALINAIETKLKEKNFT